MNVVARLCIKTLDLISFFTVGEDEVRQWLVRRGSAAPEAAGVIHSDLQKGFIRAEVMKYLELVVLGEESKVKEFKEKGSGKCLHLQIEINSEKRIVFTSSSGLLDAIEQIPEEGFPFTTTVIRDNDRFMFT